MSDELSKKIYKYGPQFYSFEEMYHLYNDAALSAKRKTIDCMYHYILAQILKKGGLQRQGDYLDSIALFEFEHMNLQMSKIQQLIYKLKIAKLLGLALIKNGYKASEFVNGEWLSKKLISITVGSSYPVDEFNGFTLINYGDLSEGECSAIADNFIRNLWNEEFVQYRHPKGLEKTKRNGN